MRPHGKVVLLAAMKSHEVWSSWKVCFAGSHGRLVGSGPHGKFVLLAAMDVSWGLVLMESLFCWQPWTSRGVWSSWKVCFAGCHGRLVKSCCFCVQERVLQAAAGTDSAEG